MLYGIGETYHGEFSTYNAAGALTAADSTPTGVLVVNGTDSGVTVTITTPATGRYKVSVSLSGRSVGDDCYVRYTAAVSSVTQQGQTPPFRVAFPAALAGGILTAGTGTGQLSVAAGVGQADVAKVAGSTASAFDGTAQGGGSNFITLAASASSTTDAYKGWRVRLVGGTGPDQWGAITAYNGTSKQATIRGAWATNPDATTQYDLDPPATADVELYLGSVPAGLPTTGNVTVGGYAVGQDPSTIVWAAVTRTLTGNVTVGGYAGGQDPASLILVTPGNRIGTNASNQVVASSVAGNVTGSVGSVAGDVAGKVLGGGGGTITGLGAWAAGAGGSAVMLASSYTAPDNTTLAHLGSTLTPDGLGGYQFATLALANAPSGGSGGASAGSIADAVWTRAGGRTVTGGTVDTATAVTNAVTVGTNNDKAGYSLSQAFPSNFAVMALDGSGRTILQPSGLDAVPGVGTMNARQQADFTAAFLFSVRTGMVAGQAGTVTIKSTDGSTTYGTAAYDVNGNISAVSITKGNLP